MPDFRITELYNVNNSTNEPTTCFSMAFYTIRLY